jgi:SEP domain
MAERKLIQDKLPQAKSPKHLVELVTDLVRRLLNHKVKMEIKIQVETYEILIFTVIPSTSSNRDNTPLQITIKMWKSGFSIDDGPLRQYETNRDFLEYIKNGYTAYRN